MSMQKKTLAVLVALTVGASFGAAAGNNDDNETWTERPHHYWKKGGGISERGDGHLAAHGGKVMIKRYDLDYDFTQKNVFKNNDPSIDGGKGVYVKFDMSNADADADAKVKKPDQGADVDAGKRGRPGGGRAVNVRDMDEVTSSGGTARNKFAPEVTIKGNSLDISASVHGITAISQSVGQSVNTQVVNINAHNSFNGGGEF